MEYCTWPWYSQNKICRVDDNADNGLLNRLLIFNRDNKPGICLQTNNQSAQCWTHFVFYCWNLSGIISNFLVISLLYLGTRWTFILLFRSPRNPSLFFHNRPRHPLIYKYLNTILNSTLEFFIFFLPSHLFFCFEMCLSLCNEVKVVRKPTDGLCLIL